MAKRLLMLGFTAALTAFVVVALGTRLGGVPPVGALLDPWDGLYRTARLADRPDAATIELPALREPVTVVRDDRGVPHIFAATDRDAITALGYVVAQDRLFQMDFIARVAAGRLASAVGPSAVETDRFLRSTGMEWGARKNLRRILAERGDELRLLEWYSAGVNAYLDGLEEEDLPVEFRLMGYRPERFTPLHALRALQYMTYDLTYRTDDPAYAVLRRRLSERDFEALYPRHSPLYVPIIPGSAPSPPGSDDPRVPASARPRVSSDAGTSDAGALDALVRHAARQETLRGDVAEGFRHGKGSNNWAVAGTRSATGAPILAGDMHLGLSLPAIWYEVHLVTPSMNVYGVVVPGAPLPVEAFNEHVAWAFTNTGADQIDHLALELDASGTRYRYEGAWRELETMVDTIFVNGGEPVLDTLRYSHWGPVVTGPLGAVALRWVAHDENRTLAALWGMNRAAGLEEFETALRSWDAPMQNILYADVDGNIAIRSTGYLPVRAGGSGAGLLDGSTAASAWTGRVPFDELPHARNPAQGFLTSTNQQPVGPEYPYYLGHDWRDSYRSLRIDSLLRGEPRHGVRDLQAYQADVHAVQHDLFTPLVDTLTGLSRPAGRLQRFLRAWSGRTDVDRPEPLVLDVFLENLEALAWDEPVFGAAPAGADSTGPALGVPRPNQTVLYLLLRDEPEASWLDVAATAEREDGPALLRLALDATADTLADRYGSDPRSWRWGDHHRVVFRHLTRSEALRPFWRGPFAYPGFAATLSPAGDRLTTHSASWRVVVDLSQQPPRGYGVYPGGQSGNPFSPLYDRHLPAYLSFEYYDLLTPETPEALPPARVRSRLSINP